MQVSKRVKLLTKIKTKNTKVSLIYSLVQGENEDRGEEDPWGSDGCLEIHPDFGVYLAFATVFHIIATQVGASLNNGNADPPKIMEILIKSESKTLPDRFSQLIPHSHPFVPRNGIRATQ